MTDAPSAAAVAASGSEASAARHSTPSGRPDGLFRETARTGRPSATKRAARARPTCPVPNTTCSGSPTERAGSPTERSDTRGIITSGPRHQAPGLAPQDREFAEAGDSGAEEEHAGGDAGGRDERGSGQRRNEDHWPDGQRPPNRPVARDLDPAVQPEQQRPDRDRD